MERMTSLGLADVLVDAMVPGDWPAVRTIYEEGIAGGNATFETVVPPWDRWDAAHLADHRLVARRGADVVGWIAASPVSSRCVYAGVVEHSVYVAGRAQRAGVGRRLVQELIASTEAAGIWTIETGIFPENTASLRLHQGCGFRIVGTRTRLGRRDGVWRDVVLLERRRADD